MSFDELLKAANELDETDLDRLFHQVAVLRAHHKANILPEEESQLLQKINQGIDPEIRSQYKILREKREAEILTDTEYEMLIKLSNEIEQFSAQRLEYLASLAQLRQVSLSTMMNTLGIPPVMYV